MKSATAINKIAELAGVSISTVSRAMDPDKSHLLGLKTVKRIRALCEDLHYRPQLTGRTFVTGKTYKVALISGNILLDFSNPLYSRFLSTAISTFQKNSYQLLVLGIDSDGKVNSDKIVDFILSGSADACLLGSPLVDERVAEALQCRQIPILTMNLHNQFSNIECSSISVSDDSAYSIFLRSLPSHWHESLLFFGDDVINTRHKLHSFQRAISLCDFPSPDIFLTKKIPSSFFQTRFAACQLSLKMIGKLKKFSCIVCSSDLIACGISDAFRLKKLPPPFLLGYDNLLRPQSGAFATIDAKYGSLGCTAAEMILRQLTSGKIENQHLELQSDCILSGTGHKTHDSKSPVKTPTKEGRI